VARIALRDVARSVGGWSTREHPWEGGSDHDVFLARGIPAVLFWCFPDFSYHTGLDRLDHVDPEVMRRMACAITATALALADPVPSDLPRYRAGLAFDRAMRISAAQEAGKPEVAEAWEDWYVGVEGWLETWLDGSNSAPKRPSSGEGGPGKSSPTDEGE